MPYETPFLLHALSPLHAGTGQSVDVIDLPIARMRATGIPFVPGSSIKGVLRDAYTHRDDHEDKKATHAIFGPDTEHASDHASALVVSDARLLAMPVRSFFGTFAWVTSPLLLELASRDWPTLKDALKDLPIDDLRQSALVAEGSINQNTSDRKLYLEDLDLKATKNPHAKKLPDALSKALDIRDLSKRWVIVDDETMTFLWETATQIDTRIRLDPKTRTVAKGALWIEESLPAESLLIGLLHATHSRSKHLDLSAQEVISHVLPHDTKTTLQLGGKATVGRGRCHMIQLPHTNPIK
jgi:CRISPR-associated protein Cmr4